MALKLTDDERQVWKKRISAAEQDQRKYHPLWHEILAFCQGFHWVKYSGPLSRKLVTVPPPKHGRRYTVDELTQYRLTILGDLAGDDQRPMAQFRVDQRPVEDYAQQANLALAYGWDEEWNGSAVLQDAKRTMIDLGTAPVRCYFDPNQGEYTGEKPFVGGQMVTREQAMQAMDQGMRVQIKNMREGHICWEPGLPFNALVPPGIPREKDFHWLVWKSVAYLPDLKDQYPAAKDLTADAIRSLATLSRPQDPSGTGQVQSGDPTAENLGDHVFVYTAYQLPNRKNPEGKVVIFGGEKQEPLETYDSLPYRAPDGTWRAGVYFLHCIRLTDRFWSRGFMELALDPQRAINEHSTRIEQTIAHGQPFRWIEEGSVKKMPDGAAGSVGWLKVGKPRPQTDPGMPPGTWMYDAVRARREDLARAVMPEAAMGENPTNVTTYSQLALLHSQAAKRLAAIIRQNQETVISLTEDSIWDIKTKWGPEKQLLLAGTDDQIHAMTFNASEWPDYYKIGFAKGPALPKGQDAQAKLIEDTWNAALQCGAAVRDPDRWLSWRKDSMEAGKMLGLPTPPVDAQIEKAQYENELLFQKPDAQLAQQLVDYFDNHQMHIMVARSLQGTCRLMGRTDVFVALELHCKEHERQMMLTTMQSIGTPGPTTPTGDMMPPAPQIAGPVPQQANGAQPQSQPARQGG
jgi:hypothetical protein